MDDEVELTEQEAGEFSLPQHDRWNGDAIVWGARSQTASLECSVCHNTVTRALYVPDNIAVGQPKFTCKDCLSSNGRRRAAIAKRRKSVETSQSSIQPCPGTGHEMFSEAEEFSGVLSAALAGFKPVLNAGLAPAALPA